ncbi:MAG: hypothetical protein ACTSXW_01945 [Candidatus Baldrarchaeia archaeon]
MADGDFIKVKRRLLRFRSMLRPGKSLRSMSRVVSRNEALKIIYEIEQGINGHPSKIRELFARLFSLNIPFRGALSPFNPPIGFYIWSVLDYGYLIVETLGRNVHETALNLALYIVKKVYDVVPVKDEYYYVLYYDGFKVGKVFRTRGNRLGERCVIARIDKDKIVQHYRNRGLIVENKIYLPKEAKRNILPYLRRLEQEFSNLCLHNPRRFLELLRRSIKEEN